MRGLEPTSRLLAEGVTSRLRTSHGPAGTRLAMIRALPQLGGFA
jgi:hypothetical protein